MAVRLYYLLALLPALPPVGEKPPIDIHEIRRLASEHDGQPVVDIIDALELEPVIQRITESRLFAGVKEPPPEIPVGVPEVVYSCLSLDPRDLGEADYLNEIWRIYFSYLSEIGARCGSRLFATWTAWELALREQLTAFRTQAPASSDLLLIDHQKLIDAWKTASDPMVGEKLLDEARMQFIDQQVRHYSFELNELAGYVLKLRLLARYSRLERAKGVKILEEVTIL